MTRERTWTVLELLQWTQKFFADHGIETARLDAEILLAFALDTQRLELYVDFDKPVMGPERARFRELVRRRGSERVPVSQLVGSKEFWSLPLEVTRDVLTPRPDTETLVEAALERMPAVEGEHRILDLGTGSGAIALALAKERPKARVTATDISTAALQIAARNAELLQMSERIRLLEGSLFEPVAKERFDLVASNPPYLARSEAHVLAPELAHEPETALFGGEDGFEVLRSLVAGAPEHIEPGGWLLVEIGEGQQAAVEGFCGEAGMVDIAALRDLAGHVRVIAARRAPVA